MIIPGLSLKFSRTLFSFTTSVFPSGLLSEGTPRQQDNKKLLYVLPFTFRNLSRYGHRLRLLYVTSFFILLLLIRGLLSFLSHNRIKIMNSINRFSSSPIPTYSRLLLLYQTLQVILMLNERGRGMV